MRALIIWVVVVVLVVIGSIALIDRMINDRIKETQNTTLDYNTLRASRGLVFQDNECGLGSERACAALGRAYYDSLVIH